MEQISLTAERTLNLTLNVDAPMFLFPVNFRSPESLLEITKLVVPKLLECSVFLVLTGESAIDDTTLS